MTIRTLLHAPTASLATALLALAAPALAQAPAPSSSTPATCQPRGFLPGPASYKSVEQLPDRRVTFRLCAPEAMSVSVVSNDIADVIPMGIGGGPSGLAMTKDGQGLWTVTTPVPVAPDTYRFNFRVDGVIVPNPQSTTFSPAMVGTNSTFEVLGPEGAFQTYNKDIPHGAVSEVEYLVEVARQQASGIRVHTAWLRAWKRASSGLVPCAWCERQRRKLDDRGARALHPR